MKNDLIISIAGKAGSGKSRLTFLLKKFLREQGFEVEQELNMDYRNERTFDRVMNEHFDEVINKLKENSKITLKEVQLARTKI